MAIQYASAEHAEMARKNLEANFEERVGEVEVDEPTCEERLQRASQTISDLLSRYRDAAVLVDQYFEEFGPLPEDADAGTPE